MKLTTKLLKEMIQQEMQHAKAPDEEPKQEYALAITPEEYDKKIQTGNYAQSDVRGTNIKMLHFIDTDTKERMDAFEKDLESGIDEMTPEERKYAGL